MAELIVAGTGHRPEDCIHGETEIRTMVRNKLRKSKASCFISGMAAGLDLWAGDEARLLGIDLWCARPWAGHTARKEDADLYAELIEYAVKVVNVDESETYAGPWVYQRRNEWMVDNADVVLAYFNPESTKGGTFNCIKYARGKKPIANIIGDPPF